MKPKKITKEILNNMVIDRKKGMTYSQIESKYNISRFTTIKYLRDIEIEYVHHDKQEWVIAEEEAEQVLKKKGFKNLINLNLICNSPFWDYYAELNDERWLIDVTIDTNKNVIGKVKRIIKDFESAILFKNQNWKLIKLSVTEIK